MMLIEFESSCMGALSETGVRGPVDGRFPPGLESGGIVATPGSCRGLMQVLTPKELSALAGFASFRLARVALNPADGEDVLQDALLAALGRWGPGSRAQPRGHSSCFRRIRQTGLLFPFTLFTVDWPNEKTSLFLACAARLLDPSDRMLL